ncbi:MAG: hypothetical protein KDK70_37990 [Myxococcales bacterium]|nr:hypothetical protein [Myxococcales bacterium]
MSSFSEFYQDGGVFMHVITVFAFICCTQLLRRVGTIRRTFRDPGEQLLRLRRGDVLTPTLIVAGLLTGIAGTSLGWIEANAAIRTVPFEHWPMAASRGMQIASYTLVWSLLCAVPLVLGHGVLRHFEERLRVLIEKHA